MKDDPSDKAKNATTSITEAVRKAQEASLSWLGMPTSMASLASMAEELRKAQEASLARFEMPKSMASMAEELRKAQEASLTRFGMPKSMASMAEEVCKAQEASLSWLGMPTSMASLASMAEELRKAQQASLTRFGMPKSMASIAEELRKAHESAGIRSNFGHSYAWRAMMIDFQSAIRSQADLSAQFSNIIGGLEEMQATINSDGSIAGSDTVLFDPVEIESILQNAVNKSGIVSDWLPLEQRIAAFFSEISDKHPVIRFLVISILLPMFLSLNVGLIRDRYLSKPTKEIETIVTKAVRSELRQAGIANEGLKEYRMVSVEALNVRTSDTIKSPLRGRVYFGQAVNVIQKKRNWTLIECEYEDGSAIRGWVFTRYIAALKYE